MLLNKPIYQNPKAINRGLDFVTLLIHLPPLSDDIATNGRDTRDVLDENISKAQVIYNIIASTYSSTKWGRNVQDHFAFEIVGMGGSVSMYTSVPTAMEEVVKQAVTSAYPASQLERVQDYNLFCEGGSYDAVVGGEFRLKKDYAYPIATYQQTKKDTMQALLNALSTLAKEDGVGLQILMRPANDSWRKHGSEAASKKRSGKDGKQKGYEVVTNTLKQMATALVQAPDQAKEDKPKEELSSTDRAIVEAMEDKTSHPGFETAIRLIVSSKTSQKSEALLNSVVASFSLYDSPGRNGFKFERSKNRRELAANYLLRGFAASQTDMILNVVELATLFHFPDQSNIPTSQLGRQESKQVDGPRNMPDDGLLLGYNIFRGSKREIRLADVDRQRHMYAVGQTGTGKSTYLENLALQDMLRGNGFAFVDPHGDTAEKILSMVPRERVDDVIYFSPADMDYPLGLNLFEFDNPDQKDFLIQESLNMLYKLYDPQHQGIMGPRYEHLFRNAALTVMADPSGGTFVDIPKLFRDPQFVKQKLQHVTDPNVLDFWQKEMPQSQRSNEFGDVVSWFVSKFGAFLSNEMMRNIIGQSKSAFNLRQVMDDGKILLVNLSKGRAGQLNMQLLGMIFVMKFQAAAMSRANVPESQRRDFALYVDEFQNFSTDSFATILSEARKYHLSLIVANQFTTQLSEEIRDAVFGNVGTTVSFRVGDRDAEALSKYFRPVFDETDLLRVPNYNTVVRTMVNGVPTQPFSMATLPQLGKPNVKLASALKQLSAAKYGKPRKAVEADIFERMKTQTPPANAVPPRYQSPWQASSPSASAAPPTPAGQPTGSSATKPKSTFLDDWLSKRKTAKPYRSAPAPSPAPPSSPVSKVAEPATAKSNPADSSKHIDHEVDHSSAHKVIQPLHDLHKPLAKKNISSEALEMEEVNEIAQELRKDLRPAEVTAPTPPQDAAKSTAKTAKKETVISPKPAKDQANGLDDSEAAAAKALKLRRNQPPAKPAPDPNDTVVIDKEGNITFKNADQ